ncbi:MAG: hypothetical protein FJZ90_17480 [Chloroflexi bacterium]|nr:hypothetical protein [Chloroflexota bacterium]
MHIGAARVRITPRVGVELSGYVAREQPSTGLLDDLYVRALYLSAGEERLLWLHADLLALTLEQARRIRALVCDALWLEGRQVVLSASHTHAGPATVPLRQCGEPNESHVRSLDDLFQTAAQRSAETQEATLWAAEGRCALATDRRGSKRLAHTDPRLPVLAWRAADGRVLALLANYAMHNVALSHENRLISADVSGNAAEGVRRRLGDRAVCLISNGGLGNINPPRLSKDPGVMASYAANMGWAILRALDAAQPCAESGVGSVLTTAHLPFAVPTREEIEAQWRNLEPRLTPGSRPWQAMRAWREDALAGLARGPLQYVETDLQAVRIGPYRFACLGAEVFSHLAPALRARHGEGVYVVGCANGDLGYLAPVAVYDEGGYEVDGAYRYYGEYPLAPGGFEYLRDRVSDLIGVLAAPG